MREILFRAKRKDNGEWVEGSYMPWYYSSRMGKTPAIFWNDDVFCKTYRTPVLPETVGQYSGLTDMNGTKIFEGDVVNVNTNKDTLCQRYEGRNLVVRFDEYHRFVASGRLEYPLCNHYEWEVIGNIYDNPELLEGGVQE